MDEVRWHPAPAPRILRQPRRRRARRRRTGATMRRVAVVLALLALLVLLASPAAARKRSKSYLLVTGGAGGLTGKLSGDVVKDRTTPRLDLGVGFQLSSKLLLEFSYGWSGTWTSDYRPLSPDEGIPPDTERAFEVGTNPIFVRCRYAHSGVREEYVKPEWSAGIGFVQVTRHLRNPPIIEPEETSQLLFSVELGASALFVFTKDFMTSIGLRYTITERRGIVTDLDHLDSIAFVVNFRGFLPSPRDFAEP
jgi:hypothetical protein